MTLANFNAKSPLLAESNIKSPGEAEENIDQDDHWKSPQGLGEVPPLAADPSPRQVEDPWDDDDTDLLSVLSNLAEEESHPGPCSALPVVATTATNPSTESNSNSTNWVRSEFDTVASNSCPPAGLLRSRNSSWVQSEV